MVQQGTEGQSVPPGGGEVGDLDPAVVFGDLPAPGQQRLTGVGFPSQNWTWNWTGLQTKRRQERERFRKSMENRHIQRLVQGPNVVLFFQ